ncbi:MAG: phosphoribosylaminoimidazolesuccinocarboxamide synthase [Pseudomonadales bacterium]|nr:phosphoribosylaminoimidazolesuccinocarboxamide synthase [Pseudomonadales bacterium]MDP4639477.1 phosphoribosylaminoimidazolesuccinocarboxamide synthase [Pseudomonadales bacterium]MDP4764829.1 phosphoribosylaminoimidazolesuccinocarboxamide synthase [Pseudomonadales bacterium]MDP4910678.1 phosphoribosylaminoimidazolesuccinocarboxamide synthase [Pseudomonadales bacterium]MDP5058153.1 phosphoribosylaminoimidazolesuccinocarboxamide synthase [Pseudomonadales bacterium]
MSKAVVATDLPLPNKRQGKVRDLYDLTLPSGEQGILIVATDRISVFDVVLANGIPDKGVMLTKISTFWFDYFKGKFNHHLVSTDTRDIPGLNDEQRAMLEGRIMICRKSKVVPIESIVRGYLTGSGWKDYQQTGMVCGIELPAGLQNSSKIAQPIFTPSTKADAGHDENISFAEACELVGSDLMGKIRDQSLLIYTTARDYAAERGIIIADTKFEFGLEAGNPEPVLIDEVLTPDSSRFWPAAEWQAGREQNSFDKQYVRNYTQQLVDRGEWNKAYPAPALPDEVIKNTLARYQEAYDRLTG